MYMHMYTKTSNNEAYTKLITKIFVLYYDCTFASVYNIVDSILIMWNVPMHFVDKTF